MFKLEKLSVDADKYSAVHQGYIQKGDDFYVYLAGETKPEATEDLSKVVVGQQVSIMRSITSWLNTSPIQEILDRSDVFVKFRTRTSVYLLTKEQDDAKEEEAHTD